MKAMVALGRHCPLRHATVVGIFFTALSLIGGCDDSHSDKKTQGNSQLPVQGAGKGAAGASDLTPINEGRLWQAIGGHAA